MAEKLVTAFNSTQASVYAESELIAKKVRFGKVKLLSVGAHSTDAHYVQIKLGGIYTRLEIKSITQNEASAVDREITNAEAQHRDRLNDEQNKPTWHKTTVVIGNPDNPWPFSRLSDLEEAKKDRTKLLHEAETRVDRLLLGSMQSNKEMKREPNAEFKKKLIDAEARIKAVETQPLTPVKKGPASSGSRSSQSSSVVAISSSASSNVSLSAGTSKLSSSASDAKSSSKVAAAPVRTGPMLRSRKAGPVNTSPDPVSPNTQAQKIRYDARADARAKVTDKVSPLDQASRVARRVLVTEQITVVCPHLDMTFVLNRRANKFAGHIKGDPKPADMIKHERQHWDKKDLSERKWRTSADPNGNNPLHLAILNGDLGMVKFFMRPNLVNTPNNKGELPIHFAASSKDPQVLRVFIEKKCDIDVLDLRGNTPLHHACLAGNIDNTKELIQAGASFVIENNSKQTAQSIIEKSDNNALKECLALGPKNKV